MMHITNARDTLSMGLKFAVATSKFVALYKAYDAWGIRHTMHPFVFIVWFFVLNGIALPLLSFSGG